MSPEQSSNATCESAGRYVPEWKTTPAAVIPAQVHWVVLAGNNRAITLAAMGTDTPVDMIGNFQIAQKLRNRQQL